MRNRAYQALTAKPTFPLTKEAEHLIDLDPCGARGWFFLSQNLPHVDSPGPAIAAAWLSRINVCFWQEAVMNSIAQLPDSQLLRSVILTAYQYCGEVLVDASNSVAMAWADGYLPSGQNIDVETRQKGMAEQLQFLEEVVADERERRGSGSIFRAFNHAPVRRPKQDRNAPCHCMSGKKYTKCCGR